MSTFNLTAQLNLRGPANIKPIVSKIQREINAAKIKLNLDVNQNAAKSITSITTRLNNLSKAAINANANISTLNQSLSSLANSFNSINSSTTANINNLTKTTKAASSAGKALSETRTQVEEFGKQAGLAVKRFAAFTTVTAPIYAFTNAITNGFKEFVNFNKEMVRLSQVTGQSVGELGAVSKEITRLSTSLGVASSDLLQVATTLAQAGFSAEDTKIALEALAKSALAPSFESLTDTTEGAIAAIRQFGLQASELDGALGSINAVAAAFAVEAGDIITAIQRTGGVFSAASRGVSEGTDALNEFISVFTSIRATTRESAETIATGLRTIFTRIQRTKTIEQLREFGIELQDLEGKFVGPFEATKRLSEGLNKIDPRSADFASISEELGGFRQIGKVIPLIQQFATAEQALAVAQKGTKSTSKDALVAQQSLAVQFEKTRQNFLALIRELGESTTFKSFAGLSLVLADSFINLARSLKPLLPLLLTFASIKAGSALTEYISGFGKGLFGGKGGGGGPTGGIPSSGGGPSGSGGGSTSLASNTASLNTVSNALSTLNQSILALNQNIVNNNSLLLNRPTRGFAKGGLVPGVGNKDTVSAALTPGEFVLRKQAVERIGANNLAQMNIGGKVQEFEDGGYVEGSAMKALKKLATEFLMPKSRKGGKRKISFVGQQAVSVSKNISPELLKQIEEEGRLVYGTGLGDLPKGDPGLIVDKIINVALAKTQKQKEGKLKKTQGALTFSAAGLQRGPRAPKGQMEKALARYQQDPEYRKAMGLGGSSDIVQALSAFRKSGGQTSLAGVFSESAISKIEAGIPQYISSLGNESQKIAKAKVAQQYLRSFAGGASASKAGHATAFSETINQMLKSGIIQELARGGQVQKFVKGGMPQPLVDDILSNAPNTILPKPQSAIQKLIESGGGFVDIDRTLKRTIGDQAYARARTEKERKAVLGKYFINSTTRLNDIKTAGLTQFGIELQNSIKSGQLKGSNIRVISKSPNTPGVADYLSSIFGIPSNNFAFTGGRSKTPLMRKFADGGFIRRYAQAKDQTRGIKPPTLNERLIQRVKELGGPGTASQLAFKALTESEREAIKMPKTIQNLLKSQVIQKATGSQLRDIETYVEKAASVRQLAQAASEEQNLQKKQTLENNKVLEFGLIGLRYGSKGSDSLNVFDIPKPRSLSDFNLENIKELNDSSQFIRINTATISDKLGPDTAKELQEIMLNNFKKSVIQVGQNIASKIPTGISPDAKLIDQAINNSDFFNVIGAGLEAAIGTLGAPIVPKTEGTKSIDFPEGLGSAAAFFGDAFAKMPTDVTRTIGGEGKGLSKFLPQIERWLETPAGKKYAENPMLRGYALGGSISGKDTIPAMVSNGEAFVPRNEAIRIGYGKLNKLNQADRNGISNFSIGGGIFKGPGTGTSDSIGPIDLPVGGFVLREKAVKAIKSKFNKGGLVGPKKFAIGGAVESIGGVPGVIAAITAVILPQIEQLANSFGKLNGQVGVFGSSLGGAIREASGLTLSAGIGLRAVGASESTIMRSQIGAAIGGAVGGALTEGTGKALERALIDNTNKFGKFDKVLRDLSEAPTEELRLEAAKDLQKSFMELDSSVQSSIKNIDNLERLNNFGNAIKDVTLTVLTGVTAISALSQAAAQAKLAVDVRNASVLAAGVQGPQPAPLPIATTLLGKFSGLIPVVGNVITGISIAVQLFGAFNAGLKKSAEQLDRTYKNLDEATKNNPAFGPTSSNFTKNILELSKGIRQQGLSAEDQKRAFGTIGTSNNINELNLSFRTLLSSRLAKEAIPFSDVESMKNLTDTLGKDTEKFNKIFKETVDEFIKAQFIRSQVEQGLTVSEAETKLSGLGGIDSKEVIRITEEYVGTKNREIVALKELTIANNKFKLNLLSIDNVLVKFSDTLGLVLNKTLSDFDNLDRQLSLLRGEPVAPGGEALRQQAEVLKNLRGAELSQINKALGTVSQLISPTSDEEKKLFDKMSAQIKASAVVQQELPIVLRSIQANPSQRAEKDLTEILEERLGKSINTAVGGDAQLVSDIFRELTKNVQENINSGKEAVDTFAELARNNPAIAALLKNTEVVQKTNIEILEASAKVQDKLAESTKKYIDIQNQLIQSTTQRLQLESQESNELNRILGKQVSLSDLNKSFDIGIKQLTRDIPGGGTTNPEIISRELKIARDRQRKIEEEISANIGNAIKESELRSQLDVQASKVARFNKALLDLATSGEKTKNALDKIAEAQNKFKSRRELLADLLIGAQDPETAERQRQIFESIAAARSGRFSNEQQAALFLKEGTKILEAVGEQEFVIGSFKNTAIVEGLLKNAVARTPQEKADLDRVLSFLNSEGFSWQDNLAQILPKIFSPLISYFAGDKAPLAALNTAQIERESAGKFVEDSFNEQLKLVTDSTISIYQEYNKNLKDIFSKNIEVTRNMEERINARSSQEITAIPPVRGFAKEINDLLKPLTENRRIFTRSPGEPGTFELRPAPLARESLNILLSRLGAAKTAPEQLNILNKLVDSFNITSKEGKQTQLSDANLIQKLQDIIKKIESESKNRAIEQNRSLPNQQQPSITNRQDVFLGGINNERFLQFNQSIEKFNNTGGALVQPIADLSQSMVVFQESSNKLTRALDAFAEKFSEEIKASISHTYNGNVSLNFNDTLDVNLRNNPRADADIVEKVYNKLAPFIDSTIQRRLTTA